MNLDNIQITTLGWQAPNWTQDFYPQAMPEEWQLDYFLNDFSVLACPMPTWLEIFSAQEALDEFADCLFESTQVFCVLTLQADRQGQLKLDGVEQTLQAVLALLNQTKVQAPWLAGLVVTFDSAQIQLASVFSELRQSLDSSLALSLVVKAENPQECLAMAESQFPKSETSQKPIWYACNDSWLTVGSPLGWLAELPADGKQQAQWLQTFYAQLPQEQKGAPVIVASEPATDMAQVKNLKVVAELLGF